MSVVVTYHKNGTKSYYDDGVEISEKEFLKRYPPKGIESGKPPIGHQSSCWPHESYSLGVDPTRIHEAQKNLAAAGVPTEFNKHTGDAILTSRSHRKKLCQLMGLRDQSPKASWGDA